MSPFPNAKSSKEQHKQAKIIPLRSRPNDAALKYLFLSLEKLNDHLNDHLEEDEDLNKALNE